MKFKRISHLAKDENIAGGRVKGQILTRLWSDPFMMLGSFGFVISAQNILLWSLIFSFCCFVPWYVCECVSF